LRKIFQSFLAKDGAVTPLLEEIITIRGKELRAYVLCIASMLAVSCADLIL